MVESHEALHVVAFDIPSPPDYGGVIDIFYKVKALSEQGVKIHLHCYTYGREESKELERICESVRYYKRKVFKNPIYNKKPYIVASRNSTALIEDLLQDDYPILFEGLHCTFYLADPRLQDRFKIVRTHNVEHDYYSHLEKVETNVFKKYFFKVESERLKKHEAVLKHADLVAAISPNDVKHFKKKAENVIYLPPFHRNDNVETKEGRGEFVLYHGNLAVGENNEAAIYLSKKVFSKLKFPCMIAGNGASDELREELAKHTHINLKENVTTDEIEDLIKKAHINVLPTKQATGIKLKLINALFMGRFCIANDKMINNTGMEPLCSVANNPIDIISVIEALWNEELDADELDRRQSLLSELFNNERGAFQLINQIPEAQLIAH